MKKQTLYYICKYIDFLREVGYSVVISGFNPVLSDVLPTLLNYVPHLPNVCSYLKAKPEYLCKCRENKDSIINSNPKEPHYRICYAGVEEYIVPIRNDKEMICCVSVSGYRGLIDISLSSYSLLEQEFGAEYKSLYKKLSKKVPEMNKILEIIMPLKYMFSALYKECLPTYKPTDTCSQLYNTALEYMYDNFSEIKNIAEISGALNYSASYLRHVFLKKSGKTINEHLKSIRLSHAANLLRFTNLSITTIASECGFPDSSYFSTVFKKEYKISPALFRKRQDDKNAQVH